MPYAVLMLVSTQFLISSCIHQVVEFFLVGQLYLDDPVCESVFVQQFGLILESFVHLYDNTTYR